MEGSVCCRPIAASTFGMSSPATTVSAAATSTARNTAAPESVAATGSVSGRPEVELGKHLGASRGTVREALRHLQQEGLVTAGNRNMLRVNAVSPKEVRELFRVRAALEGLAVAEIIASPRRDDAVAALREALEQLVNADADFAARLEADLGFHLRLCRLSGNSMLVDAWRYLEGRIRVTIMNGE